MLLAKYMYKYNLKCNILRVKLNGIEGGKLDYTNMSEKILLKTVGHIIKFYDRYRDPPYNRRKLTFYFEHLV